MRIGRSPAEAARGRRADRDAAAARREGLVGLRSRVALPRAVRSASTCCCSCCSRCAQEWLWSARARGVRRLERAAGSRRTCRSARARPPRPARRRPAPRSSCCPRTCSFATTRPRGCSRSFATSRPTSCCSSSTRPSGRAMSDELRRHYPYHLEVAGDRRRSASALFSRLPLESARPFALGTTPAIEARRAHADRAAHAVRRASALADDAAPRRVRATGSSSCSSSSSRRCEGTRRRRAATSTSRRIRRSTRIGSRSDGPHRHAPRPHAEPELADVLASRSASPSIIAS